MQLCSLFMILCCLCNLPFHSAISIKYHNNQPQLVNQPEVCTLCVGLQMQTVECPTERIDFTFINITSWVRPPAWPARGACKHEINTRQWFKRINRKRFIWVQRTQMLIKASLLWPATHVPVKAEECGRSLAHLSWYDFCKLKQLHLHCLTTYCQRNPVLRRHCRIHPAVCRSVVSDSLDGKKECERWGLSLRSPLRIIYMCIQVVQHLPGLWEHFVYPTLQMLY